MSSDGKWGSGPPKTRCEALWQGLYGTRVVIAVSQTIPSQHQAQPCHVHAIHSYGAQRVVTSIPWFSWNIHGTTQNWRKNGESKPTVQGFHQKVETSQQEASWSGTPPQWAGSTSQPGGAEESTGSRESPVVRNLPTSPIKVTSHGANNSGIPP
jgi:hypothetical protein